MTTLEQEAEEYANSNITKSLHDAYIAGSFSKFGKQRIIDEIENGYILVEWPESQEYMEKDWFESEAILHIDLDAAYFIPIKRVITF